MPVIESHAEPFTMSVPARLVYCRSLLNAEAFKDDPSKRRYNTNTLFPADHPDLGAMKAAIMKVAAAAFPGRDVATLALPLKSGDKINADRTAQGKKVLPFYEGQMVLAAHANEKDRAGAMRIPPRLVVLQGGNFVPYLDTERPLAKPFFYDGVKAILIVTFASYTGMGAGISAYLNRVLSLNEGDRIQVGVDDAEAFGGVDQYRGYLGAVSSENPTAGMSQLPW